MRAAAPPSSPVSHWAAFLTRRPTRQEVCGYRAAARAAFPSLRWSGWNVVTSIVTVASVLLAGTVVVVIALFFALLVVAAAFGWLSGVGPWVRLLAAPMLVLDAAGVWLFCRFLLDIARRDARFGVRWRRATRLHLFAEANGMDYLPQVDDPPPIGLIFSAGGRRLVRDLVSGDEGVPFELGNHQYAGRAHERSLQRFGFLHLQLPRPLPHMVLTARRRGLRRTSALPWRIPRDQVLPLGEPFDQHFTLHCPRHYAEDARYVFTPKLMQVLVERARGFDVEIVDARMLLSRRGRLDMTAPATYELLADLVASVGTTTWERADLYADPRTDEDRRVGPGGRRLRIQAPVLSIVVGVLTGAWVLARVVTAILGIGV